MCLCTLAFPQQWGQSAGGNTGTPRKSLGLTMERPSVSKAGREGRGPEGRGLWFLPSFQPPAGQTQGAQPNPTWGPPFPPKFQLFLHSEFLKVSHSCVSALELG